jgi:GTP-binding protein Era
MDETIVQKLSALSIPLIIVINKVDQSTTDEINKLVHGWKKKLKPAAVIPVSALNNFNTSKIIDEVLQILPEAPPYFPKDNITDSNERFFISEIIREKILKHYKQEIPYAVQVAVESFKEENKIIKIGAVIFVERDSQKAILIGHRGEDIKRIGTEARIDMEKFLNKKVFLELFVKVEKDWRKKESQMRRFGYS